MTRLWKALIVEDEENSKDALLKMLSFLKLPIQVIGHTTSVATSKQWLSTNDIDILFLDVQLEDGTCFDFLEKLDRIPFEIIFITAYHNHAIKAFKFNALDYLLKPINPLDLGEAVKKTIQKIQKEERFKELIRIVDEKDKQQIVISTIDNRYVVPVNQIVRLEGEGAYTKFILLNRTILTSKNIKYYEEVLTDYDFIRVHQSHLINKQKIKSYKGTIIIMNNEDKVPVSIRKKGLVKQILNN